ncbi:MAG: DUF58 domain-containing protein [Oscillospiraceae bacterium]|nr:DUF58 domain-containing protein [Oscillospiraceae bacterium]
MAKNRIVYGIIAAVMLLYVFLNQDPMTYAALYAVLLLPLLSLILSLIFKRQFTIEEELSTEYVAKGEVVQFKFIVKNNSFLPWTCIQARLEMYGPGLQIDSEEKYFSVRPFSNNEVTFDISSKYRGSYKVGVNNLLIYDFLGLFKFKQKHDETLAFIVTPRILDLPFLPLDSVVQDAAADKNHRHDEDYSVIADLRKYQPTDGYKKIHWKVSAKRNELISKDFQETERNAAVLLMDNSALNAENYDNLELEDAIVEALVSAMAYCTNRGHPVSLRCLSDDDESFTVDFDYLYRTAAALEFGDFGIFNDYLKKYTNVYGGPMNLIVFIQDLDPNVFDSIRFLRLYGNNITVFYFSETEYNDEINQLRELNVHCVNFQEIQNA